MKKMNEAMKRKMAKMMDEVSDSLKDAGEKGEEMGMVNPEKMENKIYYPNLHLYGDEFKGLEVGAEVLIFAKGKVESMHENSNSKGGSVEIRKIFISPTGDNDEEEYE